MKSDKINLKDSPVVWFSTMVIEASRGNFERASEAKQELERLGVFIRFKGAIQLRQTKIEEKDG